MKLGIKIGIKNDSIGDLDRTKAQACEVWYNAGKPEAYEGLFQSLKQLKVDVGLHFWGALPDGTLANLAYPDTELNSKSFAMIKNSLDNAAHWGFKYVNIHPGNSALVKVNFEKMDYEIGATCPVDQTVANFLDQVKNLHKYAKSVGVIFTVETVCPVSPKNDWYAEDSRLKPFNIYDLPISAVQTAANSGISIANDFGHTAASCPTQERDSIWNYLLDFTSRMSQQTKLIHLGFLVPPYNGMDHHGMLNDARLDTDQATPNRQELLKLFNLFINRPDIWIITEPRADHVNNYFWAKKLLTQSRIDFV